MITVIIIILINFYFLLYFLGRTPLHLAFIPNDSIPITHIATISKERFKLYKEQKEKNEQQSDKMDVDKTEENVSKDESEDESEDEDDVTFATFGLEYRSWLLETYTTKKSDEDNVMKITNEKKENKSEVEIEVSFSDEEMKLFKAYEVYGDGWEDIKYPPKQMDPIDTVNFLSVVNGIQYDIRDVFGRSPIHYAAILGAFTCTTFFLNNQIDINTLDGDNVSYYLNIIINKLNP